MVVDLARRCTFHRPYGPVCGRVEEDESVHVWPHERMRHGAHIWRHDPKDAYRLPGAPKPRKRRIRP